MKKSETLQKAEENNEAVLEKIFKDKILGTIQLYLQFIGREPKHDLAKDNRNKSIAFLEKIGKQAEYTQAGGVKINDADNIDDIKALGWKNIALELKDFVQSINRDITKKEPRSIGWNNKYEVDVPVPEVNKLYDEILGFFVEFLYALNDNLLVIQGELNKVCIEAEAHNEDDDAIELITLRKETGDQKKKIARLEKQLELIKTTLQERSVDEDALSELAAVKEELQALKETNSQKEIAELKRQLEESEKQRDRLTLELSHKGEMLQKEEKHNEENKVRTDRMITVVEDMANKVSTIQDIVVHKDAAKQDVQKGNAKDDKTKSDFYKAILDKKYLSEQRLNLIAQFAERYAREKTENQDSDNLPKFKDAIVKLITDQAPLETVLGQLDVKPAEKIKFVNCNGFSHLKHAEEVAMRKLVCAMFMHQQGYKNDDIAQLVKDNLEPKVNGYVKEAN